MRIANFVERPWDEFLNRGHTPEQALVIRCKIEPGKGEPGTMGSAASLKVIEPQDFAWPTLSALYWLEVDEPPGAISEEKWKSLISGKNLLNSLTTK